jgi:SAM-dependent methyltransferase
VKEFWNERYSAEAYVYGTAPNTFLRKQLECLIPGTALFPCEGEGRNAVFAAQHGWKVSAFDASEAGKEKAILLAKKQELELTYEVADAMDISYPLESFDVIALIYAHFPQNLRQELHHKMISWLKPGGVLILEAFNPLQLSNTSGGPKDLSLLYKEDMLQSDFNQLQTILLGNERIILDEGTFHCGPADVIRYVGQKLN